MSMFSIGLVVAAVRAGDGGGERVEVHHQQVDRRDAVLRHDRIVDAAAAEQSAVDLRMQRLDAPVHDLGEAGVARRPRAPATPLCGQQPRRAAGGEDLDVARASARASSIRPVLSETDSSARRTGRGMASPRRPAARPPARRPQEPPSPNCFSFLRSVPRLMPRMPAARLWLPSRVVEHHAKQRLLDLAQHQIVQVRRAGGRSGS